MSGKRKPDTGIRVSVSNERGDPHSPEAIVYADGECVCHLERMTEDCWTLGLYGGDKQVRITLRSASSIQAVAKDVTQRR